MSSFTLPLEYVGTGLNEAGRPVYRLTAPFSYSVGSLTSDQWVIDVPVGFETDLASIPWPIRLIFHPDGPWAKAAVIHDYLYTKVDWPITPAVANAVFYEAMLASNVPKCLAATFWYAVQLFGTINSPVQMLPTK